MNFFLLLSLLSLDRFMALCYAASNNAKLFVFCRFNCSRVKVKAFTLLKRHDLITLHCLWIKAYQAESRMTEGRAKQS